MQDKIFIIEYAKGTDKGFDGFRPDSKPILSEIRKVTDRERDCLLQT